MSFSAATAVGIIVTLVVFLLLNAVLGGFFTAIHNFWTRLNEYFTLL